MGIWRKFNDFIIKLDSIPSSWEERLSLYVGNMVNLKFQSSTIRTYISAIKSVLADDGYELRQPKLLFASLTRACKLVNDRVRNRFPISKPLLEMILFQVQRILTLKLLFSYI